MQLTKRLFLSIGAGIILTGVFFGIGAAVLASGPVPILILMVMFVVGAVASLVYTWIGNRS